MLGPRHLNFLEIPQVTLVPGQDWELLEPLQCTLWVEKPRPKKREWSVQGHTISQQQLPAGQAGQGSEPVADAIPQPLPPEPALFSPAPVNPLSSLSISPLFCSLHVCISGWWCEYIFFFTRKQHQIFLQFVFFNFIFGIYSREDTETKGAGIFSVFGFYLDIMS